MQLTHVYEFGQERHEDRYKADHRTVRQFEVGGIPPYEALAARAFGKFALARVETIMQTERSAPSEPLLGRALTEARQKDSRDKAAPPQRFQEYADSTRNEVGPSQRIAELAVALATSSPQETGLPLAGWLIDPAAPQVASWGLMRKDMYEGAVRQAGHAGPFTHRLRWVMANAGKVRTAFYDRLADNVDLFEHLLDAELKAVTTDAVVAQRVQTHPETEVMPVPATWRKVAIT